MKLIKRIQRTQHMQHLVNIAPFVTIIFGLQCFFISQLEMAQGHQDYYLFLGASLASIIGFFVVHDTYYHVDLYEDHLHLHFKLFGINKKIPILEIEDIILPEEVETFSSVRLHLKDGKKQHIYLIDDAIELKQYIEQYKKQSQPFDSEQKAA